MLVTQAENKQKHHTRDCSVTTLHVQSANPHLIYQTGLMFIDCSLSTFLIGSLKEANPVPTWPATESGLQWMLGERLLNSTKLVSES